MSKHPTPWSQWERSPQKIPRRRKGVTMDAKMSELAACACECLALPEFVDNWNRLRPEYPIRVNAPTSPIDLLVDKSTGAPPVIWSPETRTRFFQFVESHVRRPVSAARA